MATPGGPAKQSELLDFGNPNGLDGINFGPDPNTS